MELKLKPLTILVEKKGTKLQFDRSCDKIEAQYNPSKLGLVRSVSWQNQGAANKDNPEMQFTGAEPTTLTIDLFFDTYDSKENESKKDSVRKYTDKLRLLTTVEQHGDKHRPPVCQLNWHAEGPFF